MTTSKRITFAIIAAAVAAGIGIVLQDRGESSGAASAGHPALPGGGRPIVQRDAGDLGKRSDVVAPKKWAKAERVAVSPPSTVVLDYGRSHLADELHSAERTGMQDLSVVMNLFTHYRTRFRGFPAGEDNATFVNALTGENPGRIAVLNRDHPAIDAKGQLLDRWGEPFFFHLIGRDELEIRSAGEDRKLYTTDDLLQASSPNQGAELAIKDR
jgi:hypothetical protein